MRNPTTIKDEELMEVVFWVDNVNIKDFFEVVGATNSFCFEEFEESSRVLE